jgi:Ca2+-binding EF-hand superfamily protein
MNLKFIIALFISFGCASAAPKLPTGAIANIPAWLDIDGDGVISELERQAFSAARKDAGKNLTDHWDEDEDGELDELEQESAMDALEQGARRKLAELFSNVAGEDGQLSIDEFLAISPVAEMSPDTASQLFTLLDTDGSGMVSLDEFIANTCGPRFRKGKGKVDDVDDVDEIDSDEATVSEIESGTGSGNENTGGGGGGNRKP